MSSSDLAPVGDVQRMPEAGKPANTDTMVCMLERVLMDPSVPVERLERILDLHNAERQRQAEIVWGERMSLAQSEMRAVFKNKRNDQTRSNYASYDAINEVALPIYTKHGFSVTYVPEPVEKPDVVRVIALVENAGFKRPYPIEMPCDGKGAKGGDVMTKTHAVKSAVSYAKATLLPMIFNIAVTDKADDDGNGAGAKVRPAVTAEQVSQLRDEMRERRVNEQQFCEYVGIETLEDLAADIFDQSLAKICMKRKNGEVRDGA